MDEIGNLPKDVQAMLLLSLIHIFIPFLWHKGCGTFNAHISPSLISERTHESLTFRMNGYHIFVSLKKMCIRDRICPRHKVEKLLWCTMRSLVVLVRNR